MQLTEASRLAKRLIREHLGDEWAFRFDNAKTTFGSCHSSDQYITLSRHLVKLNDEAHVTDTLLHEIAHAKAGARAGHSEAWKAWALALGASPNRCLGTDVALPTRSWQGRCPRCDHIILRYRRSKAACSACCREKNGGYWSRRYLFVWERLTAEP